MAVTRFSLLLFCALLFCALGWAADKPAPLSIAKQGYFYAGGHEGARAMFVEYRVPARMTAPYPIVMIHGQNQNGSNFLGTPDGRAGWAEYFLRRGYAVYVVDQVLRGRSPYNAAVDGALAMGTVDTVEMQFTAPEKSNVWPQAKLHTQWPGTGLRGDATFEQFRASQNASLPVGSVEMDRYNREAAVALLRQIGPAIVLTHSRSGSMGWEIADDAPDFVKAVVAVEPSGPPFYNEAPAATPGQGIARNFGISYDHLTYDPPVASAADLGPKREEQPQGKDLDACWVASSPHKLPHLAGIPVLIVTAEASYHAPYDHCTSQYLKAAGVPNDFVPLASKGIRGNGHMMMLEKNNLAIAELIADWVQGHVKRKP